MISRAIVLMVLVFVFTTAIAKKIPGQIVDRSGNARDVVFNIPFKLLASEPNFERLQYKAVYFDENGKKVVLRPDEAQEITFQHRGMKIRMVSRVNSMGGGSLFNTNAYIFLRIYIDGPLKLFRYYYTQSSPGMYNPSTGFSGSHTYTAENYILQKGDGELMQPRGLTFRKDMTSYLKDCPELTEKIQGRDLRRAELEIIVMEYNKKCGDQ